MFVFLVSLLYEECFEKFVSQAHSLQISVELCLGSKMGFSPC